MIEVAYYRLFRTVMSFMDLCAQSNDILPAENSQLFLFMDLSS